MNRIKPGIVFLLIILAGLIPVTVHAYLRPGSAFNPRIRSRIRQSLMQDNDTYFQEDVTFGEDGLIHPFQSRAEFVESIADFFRVGTPRRAMCTYTLRDSSLSLRSEMNFITGGDLFRHDDYSYSFVYKGIRFNTYFQKGNYRKHTNDYNGFGMRALWWNGGFWGDLDSVLTSPLVDSFYKDSGSRIDINNLTADIFYSHRNLTLALGRGRFALGNSISGSIILNDACNDYGYFLAEAFAGPFALSFMHGSLVPDSTLALYDNIEVNRKNYPDKYIAIHQISWEIPDKLHIFAGETIVYGNRNMDINYFLPHTFWRVTEHNQRDRDNVLIFAGGSVRLHPRIMLYGQALIDEWRIAELFGNWWGNKHALQGGINLRLSDPSPRSPEITQLTLELSAIRPWTYTHYLDYNKYSHDKRPLGHPRGANLLDLSAELNLPLTKTLRWDSHAAYTKQGSTGNHYSLNYLELIPDIDATQTYWFDGIVTETLRFTNNLSYNGLAHHRFLLGLSSTRLDKWKHAVFASWQMSF